MQTQKFDIIGMTCSACAAHIEKNVKNLKGVKSVSVNLLTKNMSVSFEENITSAEAIIETVTKSGYTAFLHNTEKKDISVDHVKQEQKEMRKRWWISFAFLIPLLYISMGDMIGLPMIPVFKGTENALIFALSQFLLTLPIVYVNRIYFENGFKTLLNGNPNMNSLIAIGSFAAIVYGIYAIFRIGYGLGHGEIEIVHTFAHSLYFESAATILTLVTLGKYLEAKSKNRTSQSITKLMDLKPKTAIVIRNGNEEEINIDDVQLGEMVIVKPGQQIPVDGKIENGSASIDESALTGESIPVFRQKGDIVLSGSINKSGYLEIAATKVGEDTTLSQIITLVEEAANSKAPISKLADKISRYFVPIVICISVISSIIWLIAGYSFEFALSIGISVLVISCPCALGLATPVAIMVGTGKGAQHGILIKSAEALEIAHKINTVVLDKTGTVTEGKPEVTDIICESSISENQLLGIAAALEKQSEHPLSEAILKKSQEKEIQIIGTENFHSIPGQGISAQIKGEHFYAGNIKLIQQIGLVANKWETISDNLAQEGKTPLFIANDRNILGIIAVADVLKSTSKRAIEQLKNMKMEIVLLTGDHYKTAAAIQSQLNIPTLIAEVLPQDKEKEIIRLQEEEKTVAMIGDGINDAPALVRANLGIAIGAGTDIAIESADVVLMRNNLLDAATLFRLSKAVMRNIKQNLFWAFFYNSLGIPLAAGVFYIFLGWTLNPMFAAAAMGLSSITVVLNALRLIRFKPVDNH